MKKYFLSTIAILSFLVLSMKNSSAQFEYIFPDVNSERNFPNPDIILRNGNFIDPSSVNNNVVTLTGSSSGVHAAHVVLSTDGKTVCVKPVVPFSNCETVTVLVSNALKTISGDLINGTSFSFSIRKQMTAQEEQQLNEYLSTHDQDGNSIYDTRPSTYVPYSNPDRWVPLPSIQIWTNTNPTPGAIFFSRTTLLQGQRGYGIMTSEGDSVFYRSSSIDGSNFQINLNDTLSAYRLSQGVDTAAIELDNSFNIIDVVECDNGLQPTQHEQLFFPDGTKWFTIYDYITMDLSSFGGSATAMVENSWIQEIDAQGNAIFEWNAAAHFLVTDAAPDISLTTTNVAPWHVNSLWIDEDGNLLASWRNMDEVDKIILSGGQTGQFKWRWVGPDNQTNNPNNQFSVTNDPNGGFSHQHTVRRMTDGSHHILLFDNGNLHLPPQISRAKEYVLDENNMTANCIWYYEHPQVNGFNVATKQQGNAFRSSDGHTLIGWGIPNIQGLPNGTEIDANKNIVWEYRYDDSTEYSYRIYKAPWAGVGVDDVKTEVNPLHIYPNPNNGMMNVSFAASHATEVTISVSNLLAQTVYTQTDRIASGTYTRLLDLTKLEKGVYFVQVSAGELKMNERILIQ